MKKDLLINEDTGMVSGEYANLTFGIVYHLLLSSILESSEYEKPQVGDWCIEMSSIFTKNIQNLGIVREINSDDYVIETVFGQMVTWTNCRMRKIPSSLVNMEDFDKVVSMLKEHGYK